MEILQHEVTLDVLNPRKIILHVVQDDSKRTIKLNLLKGGLPFNILETAESGVVGIVAFRKSDGHSGEYDTLSDGETPAVEQYRVSPQTAVIPSTWIVHLEGQVTACAGWTLLTVKFYKNDGQLIQTFPIMLDVARSATPLNEPSEDYHNVQSMADVIAAIDAMNEAVDGISDDVESMGTDIDEIKLDVVDIQDIIAGIPNDRQIRVYYLGWPEERVFNASVSYIYPSYNIKVGDYVITWDFAFCRVSDVSNLPNYIELTYINKFDVSGGGGTPGRDAVIWSATTSPTGGVIAINSLHGPAGAVPAAGDMIVGNYQGGTVWFVTGIDAGVALIDTSNVFSIKGSDGAPGGKGDKGDKGDPGDYWTDITSGYIESGQTARTFALAISADGKWVFSAQSEKYYVTVDHSIGEANMKFTKVTNVSDDVTSSVEFFVDGVSCGGVSLDVGAHKIRPFGVSYPISQQDVATKQYVDDAIAAALGGE